MEIRSFWLIYQLILNLVMSQGKNTEANIETLRIVKQSGKELRLKCPSLDYHQPQYVWKKNNLALNLNDPGIAINKNILVIRKTNKSDSGNYICKTTNGLNNVEAKFNVMILNSDELELTNEEINKLKAPRIIGNNFTVNKIFFQHANLELICSLDNGYPTPSITWYINSTIYQVGGIKLEIKNITKKHEGIYACKASNIIGDDTKRWYIKVKNHTSTITLSRNETNITKFQRGRILLSCQIPIQRSLSNSWHENSTDTKLILNDKPFNPLNFYDNKFKPKRIKEIYSYNKIEKSEYNLNIDHPSQMSHRSMYTCIILSKKKGSGIKSSFMKMAPGEDNAMIRDEQTRFILISLIILCLITSVISAATMGYVIIRKLKITRESNIDRISISDNATFENPNKRRQGLQSRRRIQEKREYTHQWNKKSRKVPPFRAPKPPNT